MMDPGLVAFKISINASEMLIITESLHLDCVTPILPKFIKSHRYTFKE